MTPYELRILFDVYVSGEISVPQDAPIFHETVQNLMDAGWFDFPDIYEPKEKLKVFMKHILSLPDPIQQWVMPK